MNIALFSDSHNNWNALTSAVSSDAAETCDVALFAGDLTRPKGVSILADFPGPVHMIVGNMDSNIDGIWANAEDTDNVIYHGDVCNIERSGLRIYMQHRPRSVEQAAKKSKFDLCLHGHTHQFRHKTVGDTHLINPGALTRRGSAPEWAVFNTDTESVKRQ